MLPYCRSSERSLLTFSVISAFICFWCTENRVYKINFIWNFFWITTEKFSVSYWQNKSSIADISPVFISIYGSNLLHCAPKDNNEYTIARIWSPTENLSPASLLSSWCLMNVFSQSFFPWTSINYKKLVFQLFIHEKNKFRCSFNILHIPLPVHYSLSTSINISGLTFRARQIARRSSAYMVFSPFIMASKSTWGMPAFVRPRIARSRFLLCKLALFCKLPYLRLRKYSITVLVFIISQYFCEVSV